MITRETLRQLARRHESVYVYDGQALRKAARTLKEHFKGASPLYSIKANPFPDIVRALVAEGFGADAASLAEVRLAAGLGLGKEEVLWSAPGKTFESIAGALDSAVIVADSPSEILRIEEAAAKAGRRISIGVRVNPAYTFAGEGGAPSKFGIDEETLPELMPQWKRLAHVKVDGFHVHLKSQELDADAICGYWRRTLRLADTMRGLLGKAPSFVNLGSGIGIPGTEATGPDMASLGRRFTEGIGALRAKMPGTRIFLETGRFVAGPAGTFLTRVIDRKVSRGKTYVILAGTLNAFVRPSLARLVASCTDNPSPAGREPLFSSLDAFGFAAVPASAPDAVRPLERVSLCGSLCTAMDVMAEDILLPRLEPGDAVAVSGAGAYARALSPVQFASMPEPAEVLLGQDGGLDAADGL